MWTQISNPAPRTEQRVFLNPSDYSGSEPPWARVLSGFCLPQAVAE